jgi:hypothetical protein
MWTHDTAWQDEDDDTQAAEAALAAALASGAEDPWAAMPSLEAILAEELYAQERYPEEPAEDEAEEALTEVQAERDRQSLARWRLEELLVATTAELSLALEELEAEGLPTSAVWRSRLLEAQRLLEEELDLSSTEHALECAAARLREPAARRLEEDAR